MKLLVTDYDETLFQSEKGLKDNIKKIKKIRQNDFLFVVATGRSFPSIKNQMRLYNIPYDYLITSDGSIIYDCDNKIIKMFKINNHAIKIMEDFYNKLKYEEIQFSYQEGYQNILNPEKDLLGINICVSNDYYDEKLENNFLKLKKKFPEYNFLAYKHTNYSYLCIKPSGIDKAYAVKYLHTLLDIKKEDVFVIGDSSNDIEMIREFDGAVMASSYPEVLKISQKRYDEVSNYINDIIK